MVSDFKSCKVPDHSVVLLEFQVTKFDRIEDEMIESPNSIKRYLFQIPNVNFLNSDVWNSAVVEVTNY